MEGTSVSQVARLLMPLVPREHRDGLLGDLTEEELPTARVAVETLGVALWWQLEPYRDRSIRLASLLLWAVGLTWLRLVPAAAGDAAFDPTLYTGPIAMAAAFFWSVPIVPAAIAAGLSVGRLTVVPAWAWAVRLHAALGLAAVGYATANGAALGLAAAGCTVGAAWFGDRARPDDDEHRNVTT